MSSPTTTKKIGKRVIVIVGSLARLDAITAFHVILAFVVFAHASIRRRIGKNVFASCSVLATILKRRFRTISATVSTLATIRRRIGKSVRTTCGTLATRVRRVSKTLKYAPHASAKIVRRTLKNVFATCGTLARLFRGRFRTISAAVGTSVSIIRRIGKILKAKVATLVFRRRHFTKEFRPIVIVKAKLFKRIPRTLTASASTTARIIRRVGKRILAVVLGTPSKKVRIGKNVRAPAHAVGTIRKRISKTIRKTCGVVGRIFKSSPRTISSTVLASAFATKRIGKRVSALVQGTANSPRRRIGKNVRTSVDVIGVLNRQLYLTLTAVVGIIAKILRIPLPLILKKIVAVLTQIRVTVGQILLPHPYDTQIVNIREFQGLISVRGPLSTSQRSAIVASLITRQPDMEVIANPVGVKVGFTFPHPFAIVILNVTETTANMMPTGPEGSTSPRSSPGATFSEGL